MLYYTRQMGQKKMQKADIKAKLAKSFLAGLVLLLVAMGWWFVPKVYSLVVVEHRVEYRTVVVKEGDTLWSIAQAQLDRGKDPRKLIYQIRAVNHLESAMVKPGELLQVPVAAEM